VVRNPETETWTVLRILEWTADYFQKKGIDAPRLDAELLLAHLLHMDRVGLYLNYDRPLAADELTAYRQLIKRRGASEPVAYILGHTEFWSLPLRVTPHVLIPRGDTEILVEETLARVESRHTLLDVGTGSGAIAAAVASEYPELKITALDISEAACKVAQDNFCALDLEEQIEVVCGDLTALPPGNWDLIVSNPPYIPAADRPQLMMDVREFEPALALFVDGDGLDCYRALAAQATEALTPEGWLLVEVGIGQADEVAELFRSAGLSDVFTRPDYAGIPRVVGGCRGAENNRI